MEKSQAYRCGWRRAVIGMPCKVPEHYKGSDDWTGNHTDLFCQGYGDGIEAMKAVIVESKRHAKSIQEY